MTFEEWLGERIDTMSSHEYAAEKAGWDAGQKSVLDCAYEISLAVPKGYALVPIEPTEEMIDAALKVPIPAVHLDSIRGIGALTLKTQYKAMIQAAQDGE